MPTTRMKSTREEEVHIGDDGKKEDDGNGVLDLVETEVGTTDPLAARSRTTRRGCT